MVAAVADVAVLFLSFLHSSVVAFLLVSHFHSRFDNFMSLVSVLHLIFQAIRGDTQRFHGDLCVFKVLFLASLGPFALRQFPVEHFLQGAVIFHADNVTGSTKL